MKHQDYCWDDSTSQAYEQYYTSQAGNGLPGFQGFSISKRSRFGKPVSRTRWSGCSPVEERCHCTGKDLGDRKLSKQVWNWHKITWEIIKTATKESVSFHREQSKEDLPGKNEKIYTLKHASDSPTVMRVC